MVGIERDLFVPSSPPEQLRKFKIQISKKKKTHRKLSPTITLLVLTKMAHNSWIYFNKKEEHNEA